MGMQYRRTEIRAGIFLLISFVVLVIFIFAASDVTTLLKRKKEVMVLFSYTDGIEANAPVRFAGIKIGKVSEIRMAPEYGNKIELTLTVYRDTVIKEDSKVAIKTLGLIGGKYVELTPGGQRSELLKPGDVITGEESLKLEDLTRAGLDVAMKLQNIATNLNTVLGDSNVSKSLKASIRNIEEVTANIKTMSSSKDEVAQALKNMPVLVNKLEASMDNLKDITEKTGKLVGENRKNIDATLENIKDMSKNLKDTAEDVKKHPWKLIRKP